MLQVLGKAVWKPAEQSPVSASMRWKCTVRAHWAINASKASWMEEKLSASARLLTLLKLVFPETFEFSVLPIPHQENKWQEGNQTKGNRMTEIYITCSTEQIPYIFCGPGVNSLVSLLSSYQASLFLKETSLSLFLLWNILASFAPAFLITRDQQKQDQWYFIPKKLTFNSLK